MIVNVENDFAQALGHYGYEYTLRLYVVCILK